MKQGPKEKWLEALRSGEFGQARGRLREPGTDNMCCLGVACEVYRRETGKGSWIDGVVFEDGTGVKSEQMLPAGVQDWLGVEERNLFPFREPCVENGPSVATLNDEGLDFDNIAAIIEHYL